VALRCVIVDDNARFGEVASAYLESEGIDVVGVATSIDDGMSCVGRLRPDVTLVDVDLGGESGFDLARRLADADSRTRPTVILISAYDQREYEDLIDASPAIGFIPKLELSAETIEELLWRRGRP
jgi:DNA-binding response OmpR family regulator